MGLQDLIVTPIYLGLFIFGAYLVRPYVTNTQTRKFFIPALLLKFLGAIALGLIYQFYYGGGDTFAYWQHGSRLIWEAFMEDPEIGFRLLSQSGGLRNLDDTFIYSSRIWYFRDTHSYMIIRIAAFFDLFTYHTYSATALFFAGFSFSGMWALFSAIQQKYPSWTGSLTFAILFIPSVIFWGSGILKDPITIGALGWLVWTMFGVIEQGKITLPRLIVLVGSVWLIFSIKVYVLLCLLPNLMLWFYLKTIKKIRNSVIKSLIIPVLIILFGISTYGITLLLSTEEYNLSNIAEKAAITAHDIRYGWGARTNGEGGYDLGTLDGSWQSMIRLAPAAINVSLFRPYLWEAKNPLMMISAIESLIIFILTIRLIVSGKWKLISKEPFLIFCLSFSILFAFAVGVSTFNFGTLMRYKIPFLPFYLTTLIFSFRPSRIKP